MTKLNDLNEGDLFVFVGEEPIYPYRGNGWFGGGGDGGPYNSPVETEVVRVPKIDHTTLTRLLGTTSKGYRYWLAEDLYVYQQLPSGETNGYLCSMVAWESHLHKLLNDRDLVSL